MKEENDGSNHKIDDEKKSQQNIEQNFNKNLFDNYMDCGEELNFIDTEGAFEMFK